MPCPAAEDWISANPSQDLRTANDKALLHWPCLDCQHTVGRQLAMKDEGLYKMADSMGD